MAEDWAVDVRKYDPAAEDSVIAAIVRHCGIALRSRDASLVSFTDPDELNTVRESFLKKKLGLTDPDEVLDAAIARVGERMKADTTRNRVTVYYLLAQLFGKLGLFGATAAAAAPAPEPEPVVVPPVVVPPVVAPVAAVAAPVVAAAPVMAAAAPTRAAHVATVGRQKRDDDGIFGTAFWTLGVLGVGILGAAIFGSQIGQLVGRPARPAVVEVAAPAPVVATPSIPAGYGVLAETVEGKPALNVYFGTAEREVAPLGTDAAELKAYIDANPGERLSVSGYVDPRGDAAFNAELAKNRAENTKTALVAAGIPEDRIDLDKPADIVGGDASLAEDRRVTIRVKVFGVVADPAAVDKTQAMP